MISVWNCMRLSLLTLLPAFLLFSICHLNVDDLVTRRIDVIDLIDFNALVDENGVYDLRVWLLHDSFSLIWRCWLEISLVMLVLWDFTFNIDFSNLARSRNDLALVFTSKYNIACVWRQKLLSFLVLISCFLWWVSGWEESSVLVQVRSLIRQKSSLFLCVLHGEISIRKHVEFEILNVLLCSWNVILNCVLLFALLWHFPPVVVRLNDVVALNDDKLKDFLLLWLFTCFLLHWFLLHFRTFTSIRLSFLSFPSLRNSYSRPWVSKETSFLDYLGLTDSR